MGISFHDYISTKDNPQIDRFKAVFGDSIPKNVSNSQRLIRMMVSTEFQFRIFNECYMEYFKYKLQN